MSKARAQYSLVSDSDAGRNSTDEANQFSVGSYPYTTVPLVLPARWLQGPVEKITRVVKPKHVVLILHIVLIQ